MSLRDLLSQAVRPKLHERFGNLLEAEIDQDDEEHLEADSSRGDGALNGLSLIIEYKDSKGAVTQRVITCKQLQVRASRDYVSAFCHHRHGIRSFRVDRIIEIFDPLTGESLSPVQAFFAQFSPDKVTRSGLSWNLPVSKRSDLIALLNTLVFLARCDKDFHPAEKQSIEEAVTRFWLRFEIAADCDLDDITSYARRLAPDGEEFWIGMHRMREEPILGGVFRQAARLLIEADGIIRPEEAYWAVEIDAFLSDA